MKDLYTILPVLTINVIAWHKTIIASASTYSTDILLFSKTISNEASVDSRGWPL